VRGLREAILLGAGLAAIGLLGWTFGIDDLAAAFRRVSPGYLCMYVVLATAVVVGQSLRWRLVARALGANPPLARLVQGRLAGDAVGLIVPSAKMAGEPVRFLLVYSRCGDGPRTGAGVTIDRILEAMGNLLCAVAYVAVFAHAQSAQSQRGSTRVLIIAALILLAAVAILLELARRGVRPLAPLYGPRAQRRFPQLAGWMDGLRGTEDHLVRFFRDHKAAFVRGLLASLLIEGLAIVEYHVLLTTFAIHLDLPTLLMALVTSGLARAAPTPAGLGALEAGQVALLEVTTGQGEIGFVVGIVMRLHETLMTAVGLAVLSLSGVSFSRARRLMSTAARPAG
jgi:uncharacterized protein (TIRG00374 family)